VLHRGAKFLFNYWYKRNSDLPVTDSLTIKECLDLSFTELSQLLVLCLMQANDTLTEVEWSQVPKQFEEFVKVYQRCPVISVRRCYKQCLTRNSRRALVAGNLCTSELVLDLIVYPPEDSDIYFVEMYFVLCADWQLRYFDSRQWPTPKIHVISEPTP
jgi:hypothetical protein